MPFAEFDASIAADLVNEPPGHDVAFFVFGQIFSSPVGHKLLHAEPHLAFFGIDADHQTPSPFARLADFSGLPDPLSGLISLT